jgi:hypothetical protein
VNSSGDSYALSRLAFGADDVSLAEISRLGLGVWTEEQLHPNDSADTACAKRLAELKLRVRYGESKDWPAMDELRPLQWLDAPVEKLFALNDPAKPVANQETARPRLEVMAAIITSRPLLGLLVSLPFDL